MHREGISLRSDRCAHEICLAAVVDLRPFLGVADGRRSASLIAGAKLDPGQCFTDALDDNSRPCAAGWSGCFRQETDAVENHYGGDISSSGA